jgi:hypothetical protein
MVRIDNALISLVFASISLVTAYFMIQKNNKLLENAVKEGLKLNSKAIQSFIEDHKANISRAHSLMGNLGNDKKRLMAGEKLVNSEIYRMNPILDLIKNSLSPELRDWLDNNPDLIMEIMPKISQIMGQMPKDAEYSTSSETSPHPFGLFSEE